jgi:CHAT domain
VEDIAFGNKTHNEVYGDQIHTEGPESPGKILAPYPGPGRAGPDQRRVILLLSANPRLTPSLRLGAEKREIDHQINAARHRQRLEIQTADAVQAGDLQEAFLRHRPTVVHFSGHGSGAGGILLETEQGFPHVVAPRALSTLFAILRGSIRCVVLNACLTEDQARAIAEHLPCVVGMSGEVTDRVAIKFASAFYSAIAYGESVRQAFELGRNMIDLSNLAGSQIPVLIDSHGQADRVVIVN